MSFLEILPIPITVLILGAAVAYLAFRRKKGEKCIGCPYCDSCPSAGRSCACDQTNIEKENKDLQNVKFSAEDAENSRNGK